MEKLKFNHKIISFWFHYLFTKAKIKDYELFKLKKEETNDEIILCLGYFNKLIKNKKTGVYTLMSKIDNQWTDVTSKIDIKNNKSISYFFYLGN